MIKAVFIDVDGTLLSYTTNPAHIPAPTLEALRLLQRNGHVVALATGRSFATAGVLMRDLGIATAALCTGAHIVLNGETIQTSRIPQETAESIVKSAAGLGCTVFACTDRYMYACNESEEIGRFLIEQSIEGNMLRPIGDMRGVCMFNIYGDNLPARECMAGVDATYGKSSVEILPAGVTKATGIQVIADRLGIPLCDTVAFGDGDNDAAMLCAAGIGVAVGNGSEAARNAADIVCEPIDEGGIFMALRRMELI